MQINQKELSRVLAEHEGWSLEIKITKEKTRTLKQSNSIHLYCKQLGDALNDAGLDMRVVLKPEINIPWTMQTVKDFLWRRIQILLGKPESTTKLKTNDVPEIYKVLDREIAEKHKVHVEFPFECDECHGLSKHYDGCSNY